MLICCGAWEAFAQIAKPQRTPTVLKYLVNGMIKFSTIDFGFVFRINGANLNRTPAVHN